MLPTLEFYGGYVMISRSYRRGKNVKVGDLVSFYSVVEPRELVIKRVVGLEGDYVLRDTPEKNDIMIQVNIRCFQI
jgi:inner membrane protease subunit 1